MTVHLDIVVSRRRRVLTGAALVGALAGFVVQTEALACMSQAGYNSPVLIMYLTHSSLPVLLPIQIVATWYWGSSLSLAEYAREYGMALKRIADQIALDYDRRLSTLAYASRVTALLCAFLNIAALTWYLAVTLTTPGDLSAIYNCSTVFAYVFSVALLGERWVPLKIAGVLLSIVGVLIIAYGGSTNEQGVGVGKPNHRVLGDVIIGVGSVLYGLYEVLYKLFACPRHDVPASIQAAFSNLVGAAIGMATFIGLWPVVLLFHVFNIERFALPPAHLAPHLFISIFGNILFAGSFLLLVSLTTPVLGSVASVLATVLVPIVDYFLNGQALAGSDFLGGALIMLALVIMIVATWTETQQEQIYHNI